MSHSHFSDLPPHYINNIKNTVVLKSNIHGFGLFCTQDIKKDTILCEIIGQVISQKDYDLFLKSGMYPKDVFIEKTSLNEKLMLAVPFRTSYSFINHNDDISHIKEVFDFNRNILTVYASRHIKKGEEIFDKYNLKNHIDLLGGFEILI